MERSVSEKIMRLNVLPNQFYAALEIFSAPKRGGAEPPQNFRLGGCSPPAPPPPPCSAASATPLK